MKILGGTSARPTSSETSRSSAAAGGMEELDMQAADMVEWQGGDPDVRE